MRAAHVTSSGVQMYFIMYAFVLKKYGPSENRPRRNEECEEKNRRNLRVLHFFLVDFHSFPERRRACRGVTL
jgi:hypothetical protein